MSNLTSQKQNRILYVTLAVLFATAAILSVLTFNAAKKETEALPETETRQNAPLTPSKEETTAKKPSTVDDPMADTGLFDKKEMTETEKAEDNATDKTDNKSTDLPSSEEVTVHTDASETTATAVTPVLPTFVSPIEGGRVYRAHSVTVPVFSPTMDDWRTHTGVDIACQAGDAVLAAADGKIGNFWHDPMMGYTLSVVHTGDAVTLYQGLSEELPAGIEAGASVKAGQVIACAGNTALIECEDEDHVHFMLHIGGEAVDPMEYMALATMAEVYEG